MGQKAAKTKKSYMHYINREWCKACGICIHFCPKGVLEADESGRPVAARPEACIGCRMCEFRCPDLAIAVAEERESA